MMEQREFLPRRNPRGKLERNARQLSRLPAHNDHPVILILFYMSKISREFSGEREAKVGKDRDLVKFANSIDHDARFISLLSAEHILSSASQFKNPTKFKLNYSHSPFARKFLAEEFFKGKNFKRTLNFNLNSRFQWLSFQFYPLGWILIRLRVPFWQISLFISLFFNSILNISQSKFLNFTSYAANLESPKQKEGKKASFHETIDEFTRGGGKGKIRGCHATGRKSKKGRRPFYGRHTQQ